MNILAKLYKKNKKKIVSKATEFSEYYTLYMKKKLFFILIFVFVLITVRVLFFNYKTKIKIF